MTQLQVLEQMGFPVFATRQKQHNFYNGEKIRFNPVNVLFNCRCLALLPFSSDNQNGLDETQQEILMGMLGVIDYSSDDCMILEVFYDRETSLIGDELKKYSPFSILIFDKNLKLNCKNSFIVNTFNPVDLSNSNEQKKFAYKDLLQLKQYLSENYGKN